MIDSQRKISISAPGSVMLLGEHAVLQGFGAVVCAIDKWMRVTLSPRKDRNIVIHSALGEYRTSLDQHDIEKPFQFVLASIRYLSSTLPSGFELEIVSDFSDEVGLGSSAAVTVATLGALSDWQFNTLDVDLLYTSAFSVIRKVQGTGSGADVAASLYGGVIDYHPAIRKTQRLTDTLPLALVYTGYKTPTVEVIDLVKQRAIKNPERFMELYQHIETCVTQGVTAIKRKDLNMLGMVFNQHQEWQDQLGVNDKVSQKIISRARDIKTVLGAKISGSGLGDCVVVLGYLPSGILWDQGVQQIAIKVSERGVTHHES